MATRALISILALSTLLPACMAEEHEAPYAIYVAGGKRTESCGDVGLLAGPEAVAMRVGIRLVGGTGFHWDHGDGIIMGTVDTAGGFALSRYMRVDFENGGEDEASCVVERTMSVKGILNGNPDIDGTYEAFVATMSNVYQPYPGSSCDALLQGDERIADTLPCTVSYDLDGERD